MANTKLDRIDTQLCRNFVDEHLVGKTVLADTDRAQRRSADSRGLLQALCQAVRDVVGRQLGTAHRDVVAALRGLEAYRIHVRQRLIADHAVMPGHDFSLGVHRCTNAVHILRTEAAVLDVVLTRPHHLHRFSHRLRQQCRIHHEFEIAVAATTKSAAEQHAIEFYFLGRNTQRSSHGIDCNRLALCAAPDFATILAYRGH